MHVHIRRPRHGQDGNRLLVAAATEGRERPARVPAGRGQRHADCGAAAGLRADL